MPRTKRKNSLSASSKEVASLKKELRKINKKLGFGSRFGNDEEDEMRAKLLSTGQVELEDIRDLDIEELQQLAELIMLSIRDHRASRIAANDEQLAHELRSAIISPGEVDLEDVRDLDLEDLRQLAESLMMSIRISRNQLMEDLEARREKTQQDAERAQQEAEQAQQEAQQARERQLVAHAHLDLANKIREMITDRHSLVRGLSPQDLMTLDREEFDLLYDAHNINVNTYVNINYARNYIPIYYTYMFRTYGSHTRKTRLTRFIERRGVWPFTTYPPWTHWEHTQFAEK